MLERRAPVLVILDGEPGDGDRGDGDRDGDGDGDGEPNHCVWDVENLPFPITVNQGQEPPGQITFDGNCDLVVGDGPQHGKIYRVDHTDGSVVEIADVGLGSVLGLTYRASDDRIFVGSWAPDQLLAIDPNDQMSVLASGINHSVAPDGTLYVAERDAGKISTVTAEGEITTFYEALLTPHIVFDAS